MFSLVERKNDENSFFDYKILGKQINANKGIEHIYN